MEVQSCGLSPSVQLQTQEIQILGDVLLLVLDFFIGFSIKMMINIVI